MNVKTIGREYGVLLLLGVLGIPIGAAIGAVDVLFGRVLLAVSAVRAAHVMPLLLFLAPIGVAIVWAYAKYGGISGKGMSLVFEVGHGKESNIPLRLVPFVMVSTWLTHLFGGSAGREGVAVQLGAALCTALASGWKHIFRMPRESFSSQAWRRAFPDCFRRQLPPRCLPSRCCLWAVWHCLR